MSFRILPNLVDQTTTASETPPWELQSPLPKFKDKAHFRRWATSLDTRHIFFSLAEGVDPGLRISKTNPAFLLRGFVADFDGKVELPLVVEAIHQNLPGDLLPAALSKTFSGGARVVWLFETPQFVDNEEVAEGFVSRLTKLLKLPKLGPGYDTASEMLDQFWELGTDWQVFDGSPRIPEHTLTAAMVKAVASAKKPAKKKTDIPLEIVAEELAKLYPDRLKDVEFVEDARIPLFWIPDGDPACSAIVCEWGIYSFSTRAEKSCLPWEFFLGRDFVREYEDKQTAEAAGRYFFDGRFYWQYNCVKWWNHNKEDVAADLRVEGYSPRADKGTSSEIDQILYYARHHRRVTGACVFAHTREDLVRYRGEQFLNTRPAPYMEPAEDPDPERWPWLCAFFENFFTHTACPDTGIVPKFSFLAEIQRAYRGILKGEGESGHILTIAGPTGRGKSLLACKILPFIFGSGSDAGKFLTKDDFNGHVADSFIWYVDDQESVSSFAEHTRFSERLKKFVATPEIPYHRKYSDSVPIPWYGRIVMTCNDDPHSLGILPNLGISMREKICLYRVNKDWRAKFYPVAEQEALIRQELPFFLRWLADYYQPPENLINTSEPRYGLHPYHDPSLVEAAQDNNPELQNQELLDIWRLKLAPKGETYIWEGTSSELLQELHSDPSLSPLLRTTDSRRIGQLLTKSLLTKSYPALLGKRRRGGRNVWCIQIPSVQEAVCALGEAPMKID